jgi:hypothetical protein
MANGACRLKAEHEDNDGKLHYFIHSFLPRRPTPYRYVEKIGVNDLRPSKLFFQSHRIAVVLLFKRFDQFWRMRHYQNLRAFGGACYQPSQCQQEIGMQTRLRFIQY